MCVENRSGLCAVAASPELKDRIKGQMATLRGNLGELSAFQNMLQLQFPIRLGLNDGVIIPAEQFPLGTPRDVIRSAAADRAPLTGTVRVIVVLVQFPGKNLGQPAQHYQDLFFSTGVIPTGSVKEYYKEVTHGLVDISGAVVGPYTLAHPESYYANGQSGMGGSSPNAQDMAREAAVLADPAVNFAPYDNDGNGYVDAFVVVHAGAGAEVTGNSADIWSHKWVLVGGPYNTDGVKIYGYLTVPDDCKLGVCAHELGHLLFGFPDLYDTDYSSEGIGNWCLMAGGSWNGGGDTPAHPSAWCKANQGWASVTVQSTNATGLSIPAIETGHNMLRLWKDGTPGNEYFLVENRQPIGFDSKLPGPGLLIWHIDESVSSNANENHPKVALMQADGKRDLELNHNRGDAGDPYPGTSNNRTFTHTTTPNSDSYSLTSTCVSVTNISDSGPTMTANFGVRCIIKPIAKDLTKDFKVEHKDVKEIEKPLVDGKTITDKGVVLEKPFDLPGGGGGGQGGGVGVGIPFIGSQLRPDLSQSGLAQEETMEPLKTALAQGVPGAKRTFDNKLSEF